MEQDIQLWLNDTCNDSQFQYEYWKSRELDDFDGWGALLAPSFHDGSSVTGRGILLTGGDSHGRQAVAIQVCGLLKSEAYEVIFLNGDELCDKGFAQAQKRLDALLDCFYDKGMGLCLILDDMEECDCRRKILRFLGLKLCEYNIYREQYTPLFLIVIDNREQDMPVLLRDCLQLCRLRLPNKTRRAAYLEKHAKSLRNYLSLKVFAQVTDGVGYDQLQDLISLTENYIDSLDIRGLSDEELKRFLSDHMPDASAEQPVQALCRSVQQLVDRLPEMLKNLPVAHTVSQPIASQQSSSQPDLEAQLASLPGRADFEKMPPRQLAIELFGEEGVADLQQAYQMMQ